MWWWKIVRKWASLKTEWTPFPSFSKWTSPNTKRCYVNLRKHWDRQHICLYEFLTLRFDITSTDSWNLLNIWSASIWCVRKKEKWIDLTWTYQYRRAVITVVSLPIGCYESCNTKIADILSFSFHYRPMTLFCFSKKSVWFRAIQHMFLLIDVLVVIHTREYYAKPMNYDVLKSAK